MRSRDRTSAYRKKKESQAVDFNDQKYKVPSSKRNLRARGSSRTTKDITSKGRFAPQDTGVTNRLRKRDPVSASGLESSSRDRRLTRSMRGSKTTKANSSNAAPAPKRTGNRRRDLKSLEKASSSEEESELAEMKIRFTDNYSKRERYYNQGNAIYQEYDDFMKRRRKDKRAEFITVRKDTNEEMLNSKSHGDLLKYFGAPTSDQDTF